MYKDRLAITHVKEDVVDNLTLSIDVMEEPVAVMLYIPNLNDFEHYHIQLNKSHAVIMRDWLNSFIEDDVQKKFDMEAV